MTGDFIAGIVMVAIVDYGTIVDCELDSPFAYSYHQRQVSILPNSNIIKFETDLLRGIQSKWTAWHPCQAVFCLFLLGIWKKWRDMGHIYGFYSAKGAQNSLGGTVSAFLENLQDTI